MRAAKSIDQLYSEVKGYDVVLCNDAPLATALNNRVDIPRIGVFAITPRHIASKEAIDILGESPWSDLKLISHISEETGYDIKFVHGEVENIRTIRRYTQSVDKYLHSKSSRKIYKVFRELPTLEKVMDSFDPGKTGTFVNKKVAVIGLDFFDDLDKHFVPMDFDEIDIFSDDEFGIERIYEVGNDRQVADNAADMITPDIATDVAIVMDVSGPIADSVRSSLYRKGIPFKNTLSVKDLSQIRDYLEFITLALSFDTIRIRQVRELFSTYGGFIQHKQDEYLLSINIGNMDDGSVSKRLANIMRNVREMTFKEVCDSIVRRKHRPQIYMLLEDLDVTDRKVTDGLVNSMTYAVNNISDLRHNEEIPEEEKQGVLLVDCSNSVFVDRPFIMFLGLGQEWSRTSIGKEYVDRETEKELGVSRFQTLIQQGSSKIYLVNSMKNGKESRPCQFFDDLIGKPAKTFDDVCNEVVKGTWHQIPEAIKRSSKGKAAGGKAEKFSKSSLDQYLTCPKMFMFGRMISTPDSESTVTGNIIHEFAELCVCYPDTVNKNGLDMYAEMIAERCAGLACPELKDVDISRIRVALKNIHSFASSLPKVPLDMATDEKWKKNMFFDHHNLTTTSSWVEPRKESDKTPLKGYFDLLYNGIIVDYKTGVSKELSDIRKEMDENKKDTYIEMQALVYLALLDDIQKGKKSFRIFYVLDNALESSADERYDVRQNFRDVRLLEMTREEFISTDLKEIVAEKYPFMNDIWSAFTDRIITIGVSDPSAWKDDEGLAQLISSVSKKVKASTVINKAIDIMSKRAIITETELLVTKDMLDEFRSLVKENHDKMTKERLEGFPAEISKRCKRCDFASVCMSAGIEEEGDD